MCILKERASSSRAEISAKNTALGPSYTNMIMQRSAKAFLPTQTRFGEAYELGESFLDSCLVKYVLTGLNRTQHSTLSDGTSEHGTAPSR